jgi:hypothetical protein
MIGRRGLLTCASRLRRWSSNSTQKMGGEHASGNAACLPASSWKVLQGPLIRSDTESEAFVIPRTNHPGVRQPIHQPAPPDSAPPYRRREAMGSSPATQRVGSAAGDEHRPRKEGDAERIEEQATNQPTFAAKVPHKSPHSDVPYLCVRGNGIVIP